MLINLRQKMARLFVHRKLFREAKTEIELLMKSRKHKGYKIPNEVLSWMELEWYRQAAANSSNSRFYSDYLADAEALLWGDMVEETVIVDAVNERKGILNFIESESKFGFFKYRGTLKEV